MHAVVAEILAHRAAGIRRQKLHRRRLGGGRRHHDGVFHRAILFQRAHQLRHRGAFLADRHIDAVKLLLVVAGSVHALLVNDRIDDHGRLAGLPVADDQLALPAPDRNQRIDRLDARLHRLMHRLARNDPRRLHLNLRPRHIGQRPLAVDRVAQPVHHAPQQPAPHRHVHDAARAADRIPLADSAVVAKDHDTDIVGLEVQRHAADPGTRELHHLAGHHILQAEHTRNAVAHRKDLAGLGNIGFGIERSDLLLQDVRDLRGADLHIRQLPSWRTANVANWI